jgi:pimeloyl-ACP methyl ester carboxylesterase
MTSVQTRDAIDARPGASPSRPAGPSARRRRNDDGHRAPAVQPKGITFHVAVSGRPDGLPVLCLHGFPEGWMSWRPVMHELGEARLYAPDLRAYGETDRPRNGHDVFTLTDDIGALIQALGLERPVLVSHDWGGALGWIFAHRYSSLIRRLAVAERPGDGARAWRPPGLSSPSRPRSRLRDPRDRSRRPPARSVRAVHAGDVR